MDKPDHLSQLLSCHFINFLTNAIFLFHHHLIPLQLIHQKHLFDFDIDRMRKILFETGLMINYKYGMSREIIYDYDEIEWTLRNKINCLPKIDMKNIRYFNYQFELYEESFPMQEQTKIIHQFIEMILHNEASNN